MAAVNAPAFVSLLLLMKMSMVVVDAGGGWLIDYGDADEDDYDDYGGE
jgi:hypothetical protein